jgi:UDP-glucose 4-epimerase
VSAGKPIAFIGGAGFLGRSFIGRLAEGASYERTEFRCLDRVALPEGCARPRNFREWTGDAMDASVLEPVLDGCGTVWIRAAMLGGAPSVDMQNVELYCSVNADLVARVLAVCDSVGCRRVFLDSSEQVFGDSADTQCQTPRSEPRAMNFYGATKLIAEKLVSMWAREAPEGTERSAQILRYSRVRAADTRDVIFHMVRAALAGEPIRIFGNTDHRISFVHVADVMRANLAALERAPRLAVYHVSSDRPVALGDLARRVQRCAGAIARSSSPIERVSTSDAPVWEPHVVGMEWEESARALGLGTPASLDEMIEQTFEFCSSLS